MPSSELTKGEIKVLQGIADGLSAPEIASLQFLARNTVESYRESAYKKLKVHNRMQAIAKASSLGVLKCLGD